MVQIVKELTRLKSQTAADDDKMDTLARLLAQAKALRQVPAAYRTLSLPEICILYVGDCGALYLRRQPYRGQRRDLKTVTAIACRALVSATQTFAAHEGR